MKIFTSLVALALLFTNVCLAQDEPGQPHEIKTIFRDNRPHASGAFGALSNKFSTIKGEPANIVEIYGGWYVNHRFLLGVGAAASTNNIVVPIEFRTEPTRRMSYEYGQVGLMTEYIVASDRSLHIGFQMFAGAGFTLQYDRDQHKSENENDEIRDYDHDTNWFTVAEPGVKVEMNIFRWMRFAPGISYRLAHGSNGKGMSDDDINGTSINLTLKFGKF